MGVLVSMTDIEIIEVGKGTNIHYTIPYEQRKRYGIKEENLFFEQPFLFGRFRRRFIAIYNEDKTPLIIKGTAKITSETLYLAERSTALSRAVKEMFAKYFATKKMFFFVVIGVVGVLAYFIYTGQVKI